MIIEFVLTGWLWWIGLGITILVFIYAIGYILTTLLVLGSK